MDKGMSFAKQNQDVAAKKKIIYIAICSAFSFLYFISYPKMINGTMQSNGKRFPLIPATISVLKWKYLQKVSHTDAFKDGHKTGSMSLRFAPLFFSKYLPGRLF